MAVTLEHNDPDCTGEWQLEVWGWREYFRCDGCGGVAYYSDEVMAAVVREFELTELLAALSRRQA